MIWLLWRTCRASGPGLRSCSPTTQLILYSHVKPFHDTINKKKWFESIRGLLAIKLGPSKVPLLYLVRMNQAPVDFEFGVPGFDEELAACGRHDGVFFRNDNKALWILLKSKTEGTIAWNHIKGYTNNGRRAYMTLWSTYMGEDALRLMRTNANAVLNKIIYDGKSKHWTFDRHTSKMRECNEDLAMAGSPVAPAQQVEKLCDSFQYQALSHVPTTIHANPEYRNNFENSVAFIRQELTSLRVKNGSTNTRNLAPVITIDDDDDLEMAMAGGGNNLKALSSKLSSNKSQLKKLKRQLKQAKAKYNRKFNLKHKGPKKKNRADKFSKKNPGAFVPAAEWKKMTAEQQAAARAARQADGIATRKVSGVFSTSNNGDDDTSDEEVAAKLGGLDISDEEMEIDEDDRKPAAKPTIKTLKGVPSHLLKPPARSPQLTQRATLYSLNTGRKDVRKVRSLKPVGTMEI